MFISSTCIQTHCEGFLPQSSASIMSKNHLQRCSKNINEHCFRVTTFEQVELLACYSQTHHIPYIPQKWVCVEPSQPSKCTSEKMISHHARILCWHQCQNFVLCWVSKNRKQKLKTFSTSPWEARTHGIWWVGNMRVTEKLMKIGSTDFHLSHRPFLLAESSLNLRVLLLHLSRVFCANLAPDRPVLDPSLLGPLVKSHGQLSSVHVEHVIKAVAHSSARLRLCGHTVGLMAQTIFRQNLSFGEQLKRVLFFFRLFARGLATLDRAVRSHTHSSHKHASNLTQDLAPQPLLPLTPKRRSLWPSKSTPPWQGYPQKRKMERWCLCWSFKSSTPSLQARTRGGWVRVTGHLEAYGLQKGYNALRKKARFQTKEKERAFVSMLKFQELS